MVSRGTAPVAFIQVAPEVVTTVGAIIGKIPVIADLDLDPTHAICSGDFIEMDADAGIVTVIRKSSKPAIDS
jgi:predicted aconitase with swiveling domain